jgi:hypothetical protein
MFDDDENTSDSDSSSSESSSSSIEGSEPPPAGDDTEPAPAGESSSSDDPSDKPLEDNEGHSDSSAETDGSESSKGSSSSGSSSSSDTSSSSSSDSSSGEKSVQPPSEDNVSSALTRAFKDHDVPMDDDTVKVTSSDGLYKFAVRLSSSFNPLPQVHDDTQSLQTGSVQGALYLCQGAVQIIGDQVRVTMRIVSVETSEILQASSADGSGSVLDAITGAAGDALAGLPALNAS